MKQTKVLYKTNHQRTFGYCAECSVRWRYTPFYRKCFSSGRLRIYASTAVACYKVFPFSREWRKLNALYCQTINSFPVSVHRFFSSCICCSPFNMLSSLFVSLSLRFNLYGINLWIFCIALQLFPMLWFSSANNTINRHRQQQ